LYISYANITAKMPMGAPIDMSIYRSDDAKQSDAAAVMKKIQKMNYANGATCRM